MLKHISTLKKLGILLSYLFIIPSLVVVFTSEHYWQIGFFGFYIILFGAPIIEDFWQEKVFSKKQKVRKNFEKDIWVSGRQSLPKNLRSQCFERCTFFGKVQPLCRIGKKIEGIFGEIATH